MLKEKRTIDATGNTDAGKRAEDRPTSELKIAPSEVRSLDQDIRKALLILTALGQSEEKKVQVPRMLASRTVRGGAPHRS